MKNQFPNHITDKEHMDSHILKLLHHPILHLACLLCGELHRRSFLSEASEVVKVRLEQNEAQNRISKLEEGVSAGAREEFLSRRSVNEDWLFRMFLRLFPKNYHAGRPHRISLHNHTLALKQESDKSARNANYSFGPNNTTALTCRPLEDEPTNYSSDAKKVLFNSGTHQSTWYRERR